MQFLVRTLTHMSILKFCSLKSGVVFWHKSQFINANNSPQVKLVLYFAHSKSFSGGKDKNVQRFSCCFQKTTFMEWCIHTFLLVVMTSHISFLLRKIFYATNLQFPCKKILRYSIYHSADKFNLMKDYQNYTTIYFNSSVNFVSQIIVIHC